MLNGLVLIPNCSETISDKVSSIHNQCDHVTLNSYVNLIVEISVALLPSLLSKASTILGVIQFEYAPELPTQGLKFLSFDSLISLVGNCKYREPVSDKFANIRLRWPIGFFGSLT